MKNNDWSDIGEKIRDTVQSAIDEKDYSQLNKTINQAVNSALDGVRTGIRSAGIFEPGNKRDYRNEQRSEVRKNVRTIPYQRAPLSPVITDYKLYAKRPAGSVAGPVMTALGFSFMGLFTILGFSFLAAGVFSSGALQTGLLQATGFMTLFSAIGLTVGVRGVKQLGQVKRFRRYVQLIGEKGYCQLNEFAAKTGKKKGFILKDLKMMIEKGMFLNAHIDQQQTCLIVSDDAYQQYITMKTGIEQQEAKKIAVEQTETPSALSEECRKILEEGNDYIRHIHACNDAIPGEAISEKLSRLEDIMKRIFKQVESNPEIAPELHKFMSYYLPTTTKLVDAYQELDSQPVAGENIAGTKREIEDTLDTINGAFEKLLDRFFQDKAWDISSDISVMKTMLAQEGLTRADFERNQE